jgi:clan AA aspartic protease
MGEVRANIRVQNTLENTLGTNKFIDLDCLVDTGAVMTLLPHDVVDHLGLSLTGRAIVILANDETEEMDVAGPLTLIFRDRLMYGSCLVGKPLSEPLLGQLVLETLDLIVDPQQRKITFRPQSPACPSYKLKKLKNR